MTGGTAPAGLPSGSGGTAMTGPPSVPGTLTKSDRCSTGKPAPNSRGVDRPATVQSTSATEPQAQASGSFAEIVQAWHIVGGKKKHPKGVTQKPAPANKTLRKMNQKQRRRAQAAARQAATLADTRKPRQLCSPSGVATSGVTDGTATGVTLTRDQTDASDKAGTSRQAVEGAGKQKAKNRPHIKTTRPAKKRARLDETNSPRGEHKKQKVAERQLTQPRVSYAEAAKQDFAVAITKANGILTQEGADAVLKDIQLRMISEARARSPDDKGPVFRAKPSFAEGYLRVWGNDQKTVDWLKNTVSAMSLPSGEKLVVKIQAEIPKRVGILIPDPLGIWNELKDIGHVLTWQNEWAQCERWLVLKAQKQEVGWFMVVAIPNDLVPIMVEKGRSLACLLGAVYIRFQGPGGKYYETPPEGTTPGKQGLKITGAQMPKASGPTEGSSTMAVAEEARKAPEVTDSEMSVAPKTTDEVAMNAAFEDLLLESEEEMSPTDGGVPLV